MEDVESRFTHFLQPIRDLTKNWEVDVAAQLSEYLEELDQICISFDGGKTTMNFIEAALLIQGSACVYSKKVEYLYSLVYQALDFISNKKREKLPASVREDGADKDVSARSTAEEEGFLSLNDIRDTSRAKELRDGQQPVNDDVVPLTPMPLVPPEEAEKTDNLLYSQKGELLASRKDFRINVYTPHHTGTFLLELAGALPLRCQPGRNPAWGSGSSMGPLNLVPAAGSTPMEVSVCTTPVLALNFSEGGDVDAPPCDDGDDGGFAWDVPQEPPEASPAGAAERVALQASLPQRKGYMLRERAPAPAANTHPKELQDPWRSLDPFSSSEDKPLRRGRPFTVPRGLEDLPGTKRKRRLSSRLQEFTAWFSATEHSRADGQRGRKKGPTFADLEVLYWRHVRERLAAQRKQQRRVQGPLLEEPGAPEEDREDNFLENASDGAADDSLEHEAIPLLEAPEELPEDHTATADVPPSLNYEELVQRKVELFMTHSQKYARQTMLSQHVQDWEERMGPQLEEQEARTAFDIHSYGDRLGSLLGRVGEWRSFASLMAGRPAFEVCRSMLACLQLANDHTVEISQKPGLEEAVDTMALRLLTQEKAHERFRTYTTPSLAQQ
ncbi:condensin-2 complex subunit H2 [Varanus komodoensis]|uniref:condensin-2 complex subunit H2 n=1 Tax=Varanus komodoensis TaxID=61221 RepID=UPI001CF7935A|nr:condensin-2 complex subunit H2 [Varanus komodoensis]